MDKHKALIGFAVTVALVLGLYGAFKAAPTKVIERVIDSSGKTVEREFGALTGPTISSPYLTWGGVTEWIGSSVTLNTASSTVCAIQAPAATSTLRFATLRIDSQMGYANNYDIGRSASNPTATTTLLARMSLLAPTAGGNISATNTLPTLADNVMKPNEWIVFNVATGSVSAIWAPTGKCSAGFREI